jgi:hypothetical protein
LAFLMQSGPLKRLMDGRGKRMRRRRVFPQPGK